MGKAKNFFRKVGRFFLKVGKWVLVWGRPIVKSEINNRLAPKLKSILKEKINMGASNVDKHVDSLIDAGIDKALEEFNKRLGGGIH